MKKYAFHTAFALGALAVLWVAAAVASTHLLVLVMALVIGAVYLVGTLELRQYRSATAGLQRALTEVPDDLQRLGDWLVQVPDALQNAVRQRVEGERSALPDPALTPYLVGLLVMLGMLGTFLGMVMTLNGAVFALEGASNVQGMRTAFSQPIKGLGLAFGTSVAGVATSAMLGLMSSLSRRQRAQAAQTLDGLISTRLRTFSLAYQRQETFRALQAQTQTLPVVVQQLQSLMAQMERHNQDLGERLLANQGSFHQEVKTVYSELAHSVDQSMRQGLSESVQQASDSIRPVVQATMTELAQQAQTMQAHMVDLSREHLDALTQQLSASATAMANTWTVALAQQGSADQQRLAAWQAALEEPITRLLETAAEAPKAAAEVIGQLRQEISVNVARDNALLEERTRILGALNTLLDAIDHTSTEQRHVIETLATASQASLAEAHQQFHTRVAAETSKLGEVAAQVTASAVDVASLGEAFGFAVRTFNDSNEKLITHLARIEAAISQSMARSDEQLAYYVAQAREIIDLSISSQKDVLEALQQQAERAT